MQLFTTQVTVVFQFIANNIMCMKALWWAITKLFCINTVQTLGDLVMQ